MPILWYNKSRLILMCTTCSKVQRQTTFLHRQTRTERTGQYKVERTLLVESCRALLNSSHCVVRKRRRQQDNKIETYRHASWILWFISCLDVSPWASVFAAIKISTAFIVLSFFFFFYVHQFEENLAGREKNCVFLRYLTFHPKTSCLLNHLENHTVSAL